MNSEPLAQPVQHQEPAVAGQEGAEGQTALELAGQSADGAEHPELSAKVKEKNAQTQARGQLQSGG